MAFAISASSLHAAASQVLSQDQLATVMSQYNNSMMATNTINVSGNKGVTILLSANQKANLTNFSAITNVIKTVSNIKGTQDLQAMLSLSQAVSGAGAIGISTQNTVVSALTNMR